MLPAHPLTLLLLMGAMMGCAKTDDSGASENGEDGGGDVGDGGSAEDAVLFLNEIQAANASTVSDESGAYPDWVELYNDGDETLSLAGYYLTDDLSNPLKAELSGSLSIEPGGYLVLFADSDVEDGVEHLPFQLDADGEELGLFLQDGNDFRQLDAVVFSTQEEDTSYARTQDGSGDWDTTSTPTPGTANGG